MPKWMKNRAELKRLAEKYSKNKQYIGKFISYILKVSDREIKNVNGVLDVLKVNLRTRSGSNYSGAAIDINKNLSMDGNQLIIPKNAIVEIKFPATDIRGKVK